MGFNLESIFDLGNEYDFSFDSLFDESNVVADVEYNEISSETI